MKKRMTLSTRAKASFKINSLGTFGDQTDLSLAIFKFPGVVAFATKNLALVSRGAKSLAREDDFTNIIIPPSVWQFIPAKMESHKADSRFIVCECGKQYIILYLNKSQSYVMYDKVNVACSFPNDFRSSTLDPWSLRSSLISYLNPSTSIHQNSFKFTYCHSSTS